MSWNRSGEIADCLGRDKSNVRKAALELVKAGLLTARNDGQGYAFFPVNQKSVRGLEHARPAQHDRRSHAHDLNRAASIIDAVFKDVTDSRLVAKSTGTALVVHNALQPAPHADQ